MTSTANVAVNLTADGGADDGDYDITVAALDVNYLTTLTATAANSSDITVSSLIFKGTNSVGTNITTSMNLTGGLGSTIDITLTEESNGTAQTMDLITLSGLGTFNITAADADINVTEIDASAAIGATVLDFGTAIDNAMTITVGNTVSGLTGHSVTTGSGADDITGGSGNDTVSSGDGADTIIAGGGADSIDAGDGVDDIDAGAGNDLIYFNTGDGGDADIVDGGAGTDTLVVTATLDLSSIVLVGGNLTDSGIEQILITQGADATFAGSALDGLSTKINESATGTTELQVEVAAGDDVDLSNLIFTSFTYTGGTGNAFDTGTDVIDINVAAAGEVTGTSLADTINGTDAANETINGGGGNDTIGGGTGDDSLLGGDGVDTIDGDAGADNITGGAGNDVITLGGADAGADVVTFSSYLTNGYDSITEFDTTEDHIDLDGVMTGISDVVAVRSVASTANIVAFVDGEAHVYADGDTASAGAGASTITTYTDLGEVATFLSESMADGDVAGSNDTASGEQQVFVINDLGNTLAYVYHFIEDGVAVDASAGGSISEGELTLIGVIDEEGGSALVAGDVI
jgi:hypothetical protein